MVMTNRMGGQPSENRVLIIDDDAAVRRTWTIVAEAAGFEARATDDADLVREHLASWRPRLVILDLHMPGRDGIQFLGDLGAQKCKAAVVLATASDSRTIAAAVQVGRERGLNMAGTLQKPFQLDRLRALLGRFLTLPQPSPGELAAAIDGHQLFLEYQPKVDCRRRIVSGVEALVRWQHPTHGRLVPHQFIPMAEESGLIEPLTNWVFGAAVEQAAAWRGAGLMLDVAVNISARNLDKGDLPDRLAKRCDEFGVDLDTIILEVTENSAMRDALHALEVLTRLRVKGFRLAMDDFGTAYSSLVQLQRMPFSELKIDRSFVINMAHEYSCEVIARIVIDLARDLGLKSVAEGVENEQTWEALRVMGCDAAQGHHLSHPLPADRIAPLIERGVLEAALPD